MADLELIERNIALARRYLEACSHWDFATIREVLHPDIVLELPFTTEPFPKVTHGLEAVMVYTESAVNFIVSENLYDFEIETFADDPNQVIMEYKSDMTLVSGREYKNDYIARMRMQDGKIILFREWTDPIRALVDAMGGTVVPPTDLPDVKTAS